jgi:GT2 family glycosyltransferase
MSLDRELPLVSIVIVNYRFTQHIGNCLESLKRTKHPSFEVIVVDQLTSNLNEIISRYPWVKFLHFDEDIGVAASRNRGAEIARGAYLVFLDSDTVVHSSWLSSLIKPLEHDSKIACAQAKILLKRDPVSIYGVSLAIDRYGFAHSLGLNKIDTGQYDNVSEIFSAITACAVVDTNVFRKVGGFDERFHYWHEDLDLGWRIRLLGYRIVLASRSKIYHYFGGTREQAFNDKGGSVCSGCMTM